MKDLIKRLLKISGYENLNPVQEKAINKGLLRGKSLVVFAPTASGKTFISEMAAIKTVLKDRKKVIYMVPLVALATEKYQEFKKKYAKLGIRVALSIGEYDSSDPWLKNYDIIIVSNEKMDSLIRHRAEWIRDVGLIVCDEIHLLTEVGRGPTLEIVLTLLRELAPKAQILALSATIKNAKELARWLKADVVISEWRPVKLYGGVALNSEIRFLEKEGYKLNPELPLEAGIVNNTLKLRKQVLFFVSTRRNAESLAEKLGKLVKGKLGKNEKEHLKKLAENVESVLESPTRQCKKLSNCVRNGTAFHHSGLLYKQRVLIEDGFRKGLIKVIVATPGLAYGVNLPSFRVVMRDLKRYYPKIGVVYIPVLEVQQMLGRCGRPTYDDFGEGIIMAKNEDEAEELIEHYLYGEPEEITSKLSSEPVLRMHTLALIANEFCRSEKALSQFFSNTFFAFQYGDISLVEEKLLEILERLKEWKFIVEKKSKLSATKIGRRVSELYIDPLTAHHFIKGLKEGVKKGVNEFGLLQLISNTLEMKPLLSIRVGEFTELNDVIAKREEIFLEKIPEEWDLEFEDFLRSVKTALMFESWVEEATEDEILEKFKVAPGELRSRLEIADWLLYSLQELALLLGYKKILKDIKKLRVRMRYGVKEELIPLVRLEKIGRIRARKLFNTGLKTIKDLKEIPLKTLSRLVGPKIALSIKEQLEGKKKDKQSTLWEGGDLNPSS